MEGNHYSLLYSPLLFSPLLSSLSKLPNNNRPLKWKEEKEIQSGKLEVFSWHVLTKFLLTCQFLIFFSHQKGKFPISFPIWMPFFDFTHWVFYSKSKKERKENFAFRLEIRWSLSSSWSYFKAYFSIIISIFEEISGTQANYIVISTIQDTATSF